MTRNRRWFFTNGSPLGVPLIVQSLVSVRNILGTQLPTRHRTVFTFKNCFSSIMIRKKIEKIRKYSKSQSRIVFLLPNLTKIVNFCDFLKKNMRFPQNLCFLDADISAAIENQRTSSTGIECTSISRCCEKKISFQQILFQKQKQNCAENKI